MPQFSKDANEAYIVWSSTATDYYDVGFGRRNRFCSYNHTIDEVVDGAASDLVSGSNTKVSTSKWIMMATPLT